MGGRNIYSLQLTQLEGGLSEGLTDFGGGVDIMYDVEGKLRLVVGHKKKVGGSVGIDICEGEPEDAFSQVY